MNRRTRTVSIALLLLLPLAGCGTLLGLLLSSRVTVLLVNDTDFDVEVSIILDSRQDLPEFLLTETGEQVDMTVPAGETLSFTRDCDDLQAILIEDADVLLLGGLGPESNTDVLRDGDEFRCGDTIVFTFTQPSILDLNIAIDVQ